MVVNTHNGLLGTDVASATSNAEFPLDSTSRISFNENDNDQMSQPPEMQINKEVITQVSLSDPENPNDIIQNSAPPSTSMAPDGGLKPWLAVAGGFCGFFVSFGWINCTFIPGRNLRYYVDQRTNYQQALVCSRTTIRPISWWTYLQALWHGSRL
jgi:hypothetical protein